MQVASRKFLKPTRFGNVFGARTQMENTWLLCAVRARERWFGLVWSAGLTVVRVHLPFWGALTAHSFTSELEPHCWKVCVSTGGGHDSCAILGCWRGVVWWGWAGLATQSARVQDAQLLPKLAELDSKCTLVFLVLRPWLRGIKGSQNLATPKKVVKLPEGTHQHDSGTTRTRQRVGNGFRTLNCFKNWQNWTQNAPILIWCSWFRGRG